jgi:uncharacterized Zn finger protein
MGSMRESAAKKARRYLLEGRLIVAYLNASHVVATCRGDGHVYRLEVFGEDWACTCPARGRCAHLIALGAVTATTRTQP